MATKWTTFIIEANDITEEKQTALTAELATLAQKYGCEPLTTGKNCEVLTDSGLI